MNSQGPKSCWVVVDAGKTGTLSQCLGLAAGLSLTPDIYRISARGMYRLLPPAMRFFPLTGVTVEPGPLTPPWPDLIIGGGRNSAAPVAHIRRHAHGQTKAVQILNPGMSFDRFDAVILPRHDTLSGPNVIHMAGALHPLTVPVLRDAAAIWAPVFAHLPKPWTAVLIGGGNAVYPFNAGDLDDLAARLDDFVAQKGGSLLITPSRRTSPMLILRLAERLNHIPHFMWDFQDPNPYQGLISLADYCVVTADSVSMITEAAFTGTPLFVHHLRGGSDKFRRFHTYMESAGHTRPLAPPHEVWGGIPLREMPEIVEQVRVLIGVK